MGFDGYAGWAEANPWAPAHISAHAKRSTSRRLILILLAAFRFAFCHPSGIVLDPEVTLIHRSEERIISKGEQLMPSPTRARKGRPHLRRDDQQWVFDYLIKETGKTFHFQPDGRGRLPRTVRSHDMIAKHMGLAAKRSERLAQAEADAGHRETAMELYYQATLQYADAQHTVFETNDEKRFLYGGVMRCYDKVREFAPYTIEHVDVPWNGTTVSGNLHLAPGNNKKPLVFYVPGCDQTKEAWPHPYYNHA